MITISRIFMMTELMTRRMKAGMIAMSNVTCDANTDAMDDAQSFTDRVFPNGHRQVSSEHVPGTRYRTDQIESRKFTDRYVKKWADAGWTLHMVIAMLPHTHVHYTFIVVWTKEAPRTPPPIPGNISQQ